MAAILCRVCFVEPCKACAKCCDGFCKCSASCCEGFCKCMHSVCGAFSKCCDAITSCCDKPFSGCLLTTFVINFIALLYGIISIASGGDDCGEPLIILAIFLFISAFINGAFSYYMYFKLNRNDDNPTTAKLWEFFKYDKWMAVYILFLIGMIILLSISISYSSGCNSSISDGVFWTSVILFIYLGLAILILFSYVAFDAFKEMSKSCWWWSIPCCWPCLCIGCALNCADNYVDSVEYDNNKYQKKEDRKNQYAAPSTRAQPAPPVVVVQQPPPQQQQIVYTQPPQQQQPVIYVQQPQQIQTYSQTQPAPYAPQPNIPSNPQPGVLVVHHQQQQQQQVNSNDNENVVEYNEDVNALAINTKKVAKEVGAQAKKAGISALGWMAKKMVELNDKVQEDKEADNNETNEGYQNANQ